MPVLLTNHVPLSRIKTDDSRSQYDSQLIEELAQLILQGEGLISPLIIEQEPTLLTFRLISGFLEYHAAMRAREIDLRKAESIQAFIIGADFEEARKQALEAQVKKLKSSNQTLVSLPKAVGQALNNLESHFSTMSRDVSANFEGIKHLAEKTSSDVASVDRKLDVLIPLVPKSRININDPKLTVADLCKVHNLGKSNARKILELRKKRGGKFDSLNDLTELPRVNQNTVSKWTTPGPVLMCEDV